MPSNDLFERWKHQRGQPRVPAGFADRVMAAVRDANQAEARRRVLRTSLLALLTNRVGRVGVCALALLIGVFRLFQVVGVFFPPSLGQ